MNYGGLHPPYPQGKDDDVAAFARTRVNPGGRHQPAFWRMRLPNRIATELRWVAPTLRSIDVLPAPQPEWVTLDHQCLP